MFFSFFYYFDLFKIPFTLLFNKQRFISTKCGFLCSIAIFAILCVLISKSDIFEKALPTLITSRIQSNHRSLIDFRNKIIAIGVQDDVNFQGFYDPTVFSIRVSNVVFTANALGGYDVTSSFKNVHLCSEKDFENPQNFFQLGLINNFCLEKIDNQLEFEGFFDEPMGKFGLIELALCSNLTSNFSCKTFEEMEDALNGKTFNIYFEDTTINGKNFKNPIQHTIVNNYGYININLAKNLDLFFQNNELNSDNGLLFNQWESISQVAFSSSRLDSNSLKLNDLETARFAINLYPEKDQMIFERTYIKLGDLLARIGGLMQSMMFLTYLFVYFEQSLFLKNTILNSLYVFQKKEVKTEMKKVGFAEMLKRKIQGFYSVLPLKINREKAKLKMKNEFYNENKKKITFQQNEQINPIKNEFSILKSHKRKKILAISQLKQENSSDTLKLGICQYIWLKFKSVVPIFKFSYEEELFKKSEEVYEKDLDYIEILRKLHDIDKLKKILLNEHQQILFDFLSKPLMHLNKIRLGKAQIANSLNLNRRSTNLKNELKKAFEHFENLKKNGDMTTIDKRLLEFIDLDIKSYQW